MSNLSQFIGGGGASGGLDIARFNEPCFATWTMDNGTDYSHAMVYDHNLNLIASETRTSGNAAYQRITGWWGSEFGEQYHWAARTQSTPSSSSNDRGNGTSCSGLIGDRGISISATGKHTWKNPERRSQGCCGTWVNSTTPDLTLFNENSENWIGPRTYNMADTGQGLSWGQIYTGFWGQRNINSNNRMGTTGYNELTKKFVMLESDGSYNHRINVWSNVESPATFTLNDDFFGTTNMDDASVIQSGWFTGRPTQQDEEDNYRACVVLCDNNDVVVSKMIPHWGWYTMKFTWDDATSSYTIPAGTEWQDSWTTSYGRGNGWSYGMRHNVSMDGKYVWAYCASYYYNSGHFLTVTRVSDGKMMHNEWKNSSQGCFFIPWRDNSMLYGISHNADGDEGMYIWANDIKDLMERNNNNTVNWGIESNRLYRTIDTGGHSTMYPSMKQMIQQDFYKFVGGE